MQQSKSRGRANATTTETQNPALSAEKELHIMSVELNESGVFENVTAKNTLTLFQKGGRGKASPYPETTVTYTDFDLSSLSNEDQAKVKLSYVRGLAMNEFFERNELFEKTKVAVAAFEKNMQAAGIEIDPAKLPAILNNLLGEGKWQLEPTTAFDLDIAGQLAKSEE